MAKKNKRKPKKTGLDQPTSDKARTKRKPKGKRKMADKDKDKSTKEADGKRDERDRDEEQAARRNKESPIQNRDQDPNHPANRTAASDRPAGERSYAEGFNVPPADLLTEQEKDAASGAEGAGVGPVAPSATTTGPVETIEDQGIGPRTPYPTGDPAPPSEQTTYSQGIKGASDQPSAKPGASSGPVGTAPDARDRDKNYEANKPKGPFK
jgi:hypothetical protein